MSILRNYISGLENKSIVYIVSILLLLSPVAYSKLFYNASHIPRIILLSIFSILGVILLLISLFKSEPPFIFHKIHGLVLLLLTWATLSIIWTVDYGNYAYEIINLWGFTGLFFIASHIANYKNIKLLLFSSIIGATYASVIALLQNYGINPSFIYDATSVMHSTFGFKNHFALYLDLIIPLALSLTIITNARYLRWGLVLLTGVIIGTLLELHTRGSWLTLIFWLILVVFILYFSRKNSPDILKLLVKRKFELITICLISLSIFFSNGQIDKKWDRPIPEGEIIDTSSKDRLLMYYNSLGMIKDHPITGVGYGAFWKGFREYMNHPLIIKRSDSANYVYRLHNDPLQFFTEIGIPGGILVIIIFFIIVYMGFKLFVSNADTKYKILVLGLLMSIVACGVHSLIDFPLHKPSSAIQFWISLGLLSGLYLKYFYAPSQTNKFYIVLSILVTLLFTIVATTFHAQNSKGNYYHRKAIQTGKCSESTKYIDKSIEEGGFYLISHGYRVSIHITCQTPAPKILSVLNEELAWDPTNIKALSFRGQVLLQSGYPERALEDFNMIIKILPHRSYGKIYAVKALIALNRKAEAIELIKNTIEQHPELEDAKKLLIEINQ